jgi:hypothetical protein
MFSTWMCHTREGKTQTRIYKGKEFFQWHRREYDFFSGAEGILSKSVGKKRILGQMELEKGEPSAADFGILIQKGF